jgi:hypothetical protein
LRIKKKTAMVLSFAMGTILFATTAFAELSSKSGYDQLKDSFKKTATDFSENLSSYTINLSMVLKDNDTVIGSHESENKFDLKQKSMETTSKVVEGSNKSESYYYTDKNVYINFDSSKNTYYETDYTTPNKGYTLENPFKEKEAADLEKIADALIGNLKDYVVVTQNPDGSKELSGSVSQAQIPTIANALASYGFKHEVLGSQNQNDSMFPDIAKDIFVKEITGKMVVDKNGLVQSVLGTGILSGKDENGVEHNLTLEILGKVSNINSTVVTKPDLSDKKVEKSTQEDSDKITDPSIYLGKYKNDLVIKKDGKFEKIGEAFLDLTEVNDKNVAGRYYEVYKNGYDNYKEAAKDFTFNASYKNEDKYNAFFEAKNSSGKALKGNITVNRHSPTIYFNVNENSNPNMIQDGQFNKIFD